MSERRRTAIVTGGASGTGRATTEALLASGWRVLVADMNEQTAGEFLGERPESASGDVVFSRVDVTDEADVAAAVDRVIATWGGLDLYVNNAGVAGAFGPITAIEVEDWDFTFAVLVRGVFLGTKHAARAMKQGDGGAIVNIASIAAFDGGTGPQAYSAAKAAVVSLTKSTAMELAGHGIRVNAVAPGHVITPLFMKGRGEEIIDTILEDQPWQHATRPEDVAGVVLMLVDDRASSIVGECIVVDGGMHAAGTQQVRPMGNDPRHIDIAGVNRGTTGVRSQVRTRLERPDPPH